MKYTTIGSINEYESQNINPLRTPDTVFEMYSVPAFDKGHPEYLKGSEIASSKICVQKGDVLLCKINPRINRVWVVDDESENANIASSEWIVVRNSTYNPEYLAWYFRTPIFRQLMSSEVAGIGGSLTRAQPKRVAEYPVPIIARERQNEIVEVLNRVKCVIGMRNEQLQKMDTLIKSRFVEMFGDLKKNSMGWPVYSFLDFAKIDTVMIYDFEKYRDYPHIGIDSIEKETGTILGYRTVFEDRVISGKYLFTPNHVIYSKIRPNLNKVALPDFQGVCSADAYPILPNEKRCNRIFLAYIMRSSIFLDYILAFSDRTNLPKVNKKQVEGFYCPIPDIALQKQFAAFVHKVDKSKVAIQKSLDETQKLFDSLMQKYFEQRN